MGYVESMLGQNERVTFVTHQHWMVLIPSLLGNLVLAILIVAAAAVIAMTTLGTVGWFILLALAIPVAAFVWRYMIWHNREYIVTNRRVIQIDGVVNKNVFDSSLEKVNDVKMTQSVLGRIFDYGDVEIMTAAEEGENIFRRILDPIKFKTAMLNQKEALGSDEGIAGGSARGRVDVPTLIAGLDQLRKQGLITEAEFETKKQELLAKM